MLKSVSSWNIIYIEYLALPFKRIKLPVLNNCLVQSVYNLRVNYLKVPIEGGEKLKLYDIESHMDL